MTVAIVEYPEIEHAYKLTQPLWLKAIIFMGSSSILILAFYLFATNLTILIGLVVIIAVMGLGIYNQLKNSSICLTGQHQLSFYYRIAWRQRVFTNSVAIFSERGIRNARA